MQYLYAQNPNTSYSQSSARLRIEAFFIDNVGLIVTREHLVQVASCPVSGQHRENWHQRLSELRNNFGYTILSWRDNKTLKPGEYVMPTLDRRTCTVRKAAGASIKAALMAISPVCQFEGCGLAEGDSDPIGGGTVRLQCDHKSGHAFPDSSRPACLDDWQLLCGRHNVLKKNFWDDKTGKSNVVGILQASSEKEKQLALQFLQSYFNIAY